ncbi:hypothetical protein [Streptomyces sp. 5-10]|uniref:hypothetical protein n=1 Tax=Streptomyces sp. 5-10 TaxID=878925 RepID=UPI00168ADF05|nr:hypothetical protein [Streptomyces sp. 5-10]MBD3005480.1 hypothetical protein [Streptomyces sp. 5-10]
MTIDESQAADDGIMWAEVCAGGARRTLTHETADALLGVIEQALRRRSPPGAMGRLADGELRSPRCQR